MAYDDALADRIRKFLSGRADVSERKMFGGLCFMVGGNMCAGVTKDELMLRVGPEREAAALALPHARPCDFTGKPMTGMALVAAAGWRNDADLDNCLDRGLDMALAFAASLPAK